MTQERHDYIGSDIYRPFINLLTLHTFTHASEARIRIGLLLRHAARSSGRRGDGREGKPATACQKILIPNERFGRVPGGTYRDTITLYYLACHTYPRPDRSLAAPTTAVVKEAKREREREREKGEAQEGTKVRAFSKAMSNYRTTFTANSPRAAERARRERYLRWKSC